MKPDYFKEIVIKDMKDEGLSKDLIQKIDFPSETIDDATSHRFFQTLLDSSIDDVFPALAYYAVNRGANIDASIPGALDEGIPSTTHLVKAIRDMELDKTAFVLDLGANPALPGNFEDLQNSHQLLFLDIPQPVFKSNYIINDHMAFSDTPFRAAVDVFKKDAFPVIQMLVDHKLSTEEVDIDYIRDEGCHALADRVEAFLDDCAHQAAHPVRPSSTRTLRRVPSLVRL